MEKTSQTDLRIYDKSHPHIILNGIKLKAMTLIYCFFFFFFVDLAFSLTQGQIKNYIMPCIFQEEITAVKDTLPFISAKYSPNTPTS